MLKRSIRTPVTVLACALIGGAALIATNIGTVIRDGNWAPIRSDVRTTLATAIVLAVIWLLLLAVRTDAQNALFARLDSHEALLKRHDDHLDELDRTQPIPRLRVAGAVVATASVPRIDSDVISIAARLQDRMNDH